MADVLVREIDLFLLSIIWGMMITLIYDVFRIFRILIKHKNWVINMEDFLFWMIAAVMIFYMLYHYNLGILRAYAFWGMLLGMIIYSYTISKRCLKGSRYLINQYTPLLKKGFVFLLKPLKYIKKILIKALKKMLADVKMAIRSR